MWDQIPVELRAGGKVTMATSDGAALFRGDAGGGLVEDQLYWAATGCGVTEVVGELMVIAKRMQVSLLTDCMADRALLRALPTAVATVYSSLLDEAVAMGGPEALDALLPMQRLLTPGGVTSRGTMLWRNQAGPIEGWKTDKVPPNPEKSSAYNFLMSLTSATQPRARYTNLFVMGMPRSISCKYIAQFAAELQGIGCVASAAPNSICLKNARASKALPVEWLAGVQPGAPAAELSLRHSVAFGDNPLGNDAPLTTFQGRGMHFVSVAASEPALSARLLPFQVGGLETGTARVLQQLVDAQQLNGETALEMTEELLRGACAAARLEQDQEADEPVVQKPRPRM